MDAYRVALDTAWDWAERRGVRVDFWRNEDREWEAMVTLRDTQGDFSGSTLLPLFHPSKEPRGRTTQGELKEAYVKEARRALDHAVSEARFQRGMFQQRRLH